MIAAHRVFGPGLLIPALGVLVIGGAVSLVMTINLFLAQGAGSTLDALLNGGTGLAMELAKVAFPGIGAAFIAYGHMEGRVWSFGLGFCFLLISLPLIGASFTASELQLQSSLAATERKAAMETGGFDALRSHEQLLASSIDAATRRADAAEAEVAAARARIAEIDREVAPYRAEIEKWAGFPSCAPKTDSRGRLYRTKAEQACAPVRGLLAERARLSVSVMTVRGPDVDRLIAQHGEAAAGLQRLAAGDVSGASAVGEGFALVASGWGLDPEGFKTWFFRGMAAVLELLLIAASIFLAVYSLLRRTDESAVLDYPHLEEAGLPAALAGARVRKGGPVYVHDEEAILNRGAAAEMDETYPGMIDGLNRKHARKPTAGRVAAGSGDDACVVAAIVQAYLTGGLSPRAGREKVRAYLQGIPEPHHCSNKRLGPLIAEARRQFAEMSHE